MMKTRQEMQTFAQQEIWKPLIIEPELRFYGNSLIQLLYNPCYCSCRTGCFAPVTRYLGRARLRPSTNSFVMFAHELQGLSDLRDLQQEVRLLRRI